MPQALEKCHFRLDLAESGTVKHGSKLGAPGSDNSLNAAAI